MGLFYTINRSIINESYIFSGDDIVLNFDKWKANTPNNILYVTGLSGSGKTTLAEEYAKKYDVEMFELDGIEGEYDSSKSNLLQKLRDKYPDYNTGVKNAWKDYNDYEYYKLFTKYITFIVSEIKKSGKLFIVEGLQIFQNLDPDTLKSKPLIIKGSSLTKSIYQKCKREGNYKKIDWIAELKTKNLSFFKHSVMSEKKLNKFRKGVKESSSDEYIYHSQNQK